MYFLKRLGFTVPLLLVISALAFLLVHLAPGGPFDKERAPASPEIQRQIEARFHTTEPVLKQYCRYLGLLWERDSEGRWTHAPASWNISLQYRNHTVTDIIAQAFPVSMMLGVLAFSFAMGVGLPLGFWSAARRGHWQGSTAGFLAILAVCIPGLTLAPVLIMLFAVKWRLLPVALWESPAHAVLPTIAMGLFYSGKIARLLREGMLNTARSEFVIAARAKGIRESTLLLKHVFRVAALPVVSYSGPMLADLLTGSFVIENIFQIPGLGVYFINSSLNKDYTMTVGLAVLYAVLLVLLNLAVDVAYTLLDPRVKYA